MNSERWARWALNLIAILVALFMLAPLLVAVLVSFSSSSVFNLPPPEWSLRWYAALATTTTMAIASSTTAMVPPVWRSRINR